MTHVENTSDGSLLTRAVQADAAAIRPALLGWIAAALLATAALIGTDILGDMRSGASWGHAALELSLMAVALSAAGVLCWQLIHVRRRARLLVRDLDAARAEAQRWRGEAEEVLRGLGVAIGDQFERWGLSPAEREVALLLLKGLALKEIAELRATSERTVRQQALTVYRKAGLAGRAELSAFFLEDLLLPVPRGG